MARLRYNKRTSIRGFSLLEVLIAIVILAVGLLSLAALMAKMSSGTDRSRYMSNAATLATEKLEDLSRLSSSDPEITVPSAMTSVGAIGSSDGTPQVINSQTIYYSDDVWLATGAGSSGTTSSAQGVVSEVRTSKNSSGVTCYYVFQHTAGGGVTDPANCTTTAPSIPSGTLVFHRQWMVESPVTIGANSITSVRRITVQVTLQTVLSGGTVTYTMSTTRP